MIKRTPPPIATDKAQILTAIQALLDKADTGKPVIVAIDGRCGSGKSSFAKLIKSTYACNVFHMDDYYLPMVKRKENWEKLIGGNMDFERFKEELLIPLRQGMAVIYKPYDCHLGTYRSCEKMEPCALTVVEGSYSTHPLLADMYDMKIFLTCSKEIQTKRLKEREKENYAAFEQKWIPMEENYFKSYNIQQNSDIVLETGA
ncbi:MAG: AAA family ATPase [Clostridiales bacterium]|nr:AAA family ATPase [Clostridiales bacterium]